MSTIYHTAIATGASVNSSTINNPLEELDAAIEQMQLKVENASGATANAQDCGYIDAAGGYKTTTTAGDLKAACVVLVGGADGTDIYVARRGRVTVKLDGNCSAGDFLAFSSTAGQAAPQATCDYKCWAVALTANSSGAGGTCEALLLTGRANISFSASSYLAYFNSVSTSGWTGTINDATPTVSPVTVATSTGSLATLPTATGDIGHVVLYNSTRGNSALVDYRSGNDIYISGSIPGDWVTGGSLTLASDTVSGGGINWYDVDLSGFLPENAIGLFMRIYVTDTGGSGRAFVHPYESYGSQKVKEGSSEVAGKIANAYPSTPLVDRKLAIGFIASGAGTGTFIYFAYDYILAVP